MPDALTLTLPMPPSFANASGRSRHWRTVHREKKAYWAHLDVLQGAGEIPAPPRAPIPRATIASVMYLGAAMDDGNAIGRHKWVEDWLVTRGYLQDDRRECLRWAGLPEQVVKRGQEYRVELTLTPL